MPRDLVQRAYLTLRAHTSGELRFDEHVRPLRYVITPQGRLVAPVMVAMITCVDTVLFVPDCTDGALELQMTLQPFADEGENGAHADRWRIYHGQPEDVRWAFLDIDAARFENAIIDGMAIMRESPLAADEPALCRHMNEHVDALRRICFERTGSKIEDPRMVGIDPDGMHVRGRFGVLRVSFDDTAPTADAARRALDQLTAAGDPM